MRITENNAALSAVAAAIDQWTTFSKQELGLGIPNCTMIAKIALCQLVAELELFSQRPTFLLVRSGRLAARSPQAWVLVNLESLVRQKTHPTNAIATNNCW